ncbi:unnamed protein product [Orchesella dallaii]|uniref:C-factor n=1 Tax=Orchesella dallaii TaxID=48710 RepID=A0ABP1R222_9HEXA
MTPRPKNIVVTGANRGIGLELVKQLIFRYNPDNLFATYRDPENSKELLKLAEQNGNLHAVVLDVQNFEKYAEFVSKVEATTQGAGVNLLINNSGFFNKENNSSLSQVDKDDLLRHFAINTLAPIMLTKAFLPLLEKASLQEPSQPLGLGRAVVCQVSTTMGSIGDNTSGGAYGYRISKTALNQASKNMSFDLIPKGVLVIPLHPGWVRTDMGGSNALINTEESVSGILSVLENLNEDTSGHFMRFDGKEALW